MKKTIKRHLISALVTFLASFAAFIYPTILAGNWEYSVMISGIIVAVRAAVKVAWEMFISPLIVIIINWAKNYAKSDSENNS